MEALNTILVVIDPTVDRDNAVDRAKLIAKAAHASVTLFINNTNSLTSHSFQYEGIDPEFFLNQQRLFAEHHQQLLDKLQQEFKQAKITVNTVFREEHSVSEAIIKEVSATRPDLVIKSTHHHTILQRALITNTDWHLIRKCPAPLLLVKPQPWLEGGSIVAAVDPMHRKAGQSELDSRLLETTTLLARLLSLSANVFHSYFPFVNTLFASGGSIAEELDYVRAQHLEKMQELLSANGISEDALTLSRGELVPQLIEHLESAQANILVIGSLSRNILERAIVGSTAEKILEDCPCDVLVIKAAAT